MLPTCLFVLAALCADLPAEKPKTGTIIGKILAPDGKPLAGAATVRVWKDPAELRKDKPTELEGPVAEPKTGKDGTFRAEGIPPGTYWVGVGEPAGRGWFNVAGTKPFKLAAGKTVDVGAMKTEAQKLRPDFLGDR
ncbi:MAG: carboxypeptidase-like regulatory domain-containing protein [Gemmataceae bacterium]|nr:carboxypeptidase-like regulatory domain-containing protein [Gemmataceae bacterium]